MRTATELRSPCWRSQSIACRLSCGRGLSTWCAALSRSEMPAWASVDTATVETSRTADKSRRNISIRATPDDQVLVKTPRHLVAEHRGFVRLLAPAMTAPRSMFRLRRQLRAREGHCPEPRGSHADRSRRGNARSGREPTETGRQDRTYGRPGSPLARRDRSCRRPILWMSRYWRCRAAFPPYWYATSRLPSPNWPRFARISAFHCHPKCKLRLCSQ